MKMLADPAEDCPPADSTRSLAELLILVAGGGRAAFGELHQRIAGKVLGVATSTLRDSSQAEEVTQEVFLEIWQRASSFDSARGSASSWVLRIAHARSVDRVRQAQAARNRDGVYFQREFEPEFDSVVDDVLRKVDYHRLRAAVAELTPLQREAVTMTFYTGHSYREASDVLGIPRATMKTRVRDGLLALRRTEPRLGD
jgi:RNA polymerase sigma-70 factor (ECF subfamily)